MEIIKTLTEKHPNETVDTSSFHIECRDDQFYVKYKLIGKPHFFEQPVIITGVDVKL